MPAAQWDRYLRVFARIDVVSRRGTLPADARPANLNVSSRPEVSFRFVPNLASPVLQLTRRSEAVAAIRDVVARSDAVIARLPSENGLIAADAARSMGKPWIVEVLGCPWDGLWNYGNWQGKFYAPVMAWRTRRTVARAPFAFYVTREFLQDRYPCVNGNAIGCSDVEVPAPNPDVLVQRQAWAARRRDALVFGLIGSLHGNVKGIQSALAAIAGIRDKAPGIELRVLGAGDATPWISLAKQLGVREIVHFDGTLPSGAPVRAWLDRIDVYLQPSFKEGLPRALVEAMSRGCPAIASSAGGIPELLEAECLHRPGDVEGLRKLIKVALEDPDWRRRQSARNWQASGAYASDVLAKQRNAFWDSFARSVRSAKANP